MAVPSSPWEERLEHYKELAEDFARHARGEFNYHAVSVETKSYIPLETRKISNDHPKSRYTWHEFLDYLSVNRPFGIKCVTIGDTMLNPNTGNRLQQWRIRTPETPVLRKLLSEGDQGLAGI